MLGSKSDKAKNRPRKICHTHTHGTVVADPASHKQHAFDEDPLPGYTPTPLSPEVTRPAEYEPEKGHQGSRENAWNTCSEHLSRVRLYAFLGQKHEALSFTGAIAQRSGFGACGVGAPGPPNCPQIKEFEFEKYHQVATAPS